MGVKRTSTETVEEIRLPVGGAFVITDELGNELFRVTAVGDAVKVAGVTVVAADVTKLAAATGAVIASGTQAVHIADLATNANGTAIAAAVNALIDVVEAFSQAATV